MIHHLVALGLALGFVLPLPCGAQVESAPQGLDARGVLRAAIEATHRLGGASYLVDLEIRSPGLERPAIAHGARVELGARIERAAGPFVRPFRIEGEWVREETNEPFLVAFDGRTLRYPVHERKLVVEERLGGGGGTFLEPFLMLLPGGAEASLLSPDPSAQVSLGSGEPVSGTPCDLVLVRRRLEAPPGEAEGPVRIMETRILIGSEDHLPRRWTSELFEESGGARELRFRTDARVHELRTDASFDAQRFVVELPEGYRAQRAGAAAKLEVGDPAPAFDLADGEGRRHSLEGLRGKVVVLDFWATWCAPCKRAMPGLQSLHERYAERGLAVVGISIRDQGDPVEYMRSQGFTYLGLVKGDEVGPLYGVGGIPHIFVIDKQGKVAFQAVGFSADLEKRIETLVEELLGG